MTELTISLRHYPLWIIGGEASERQSLSEMIEELRFPLFEAKTLEDVRRALPQHSEGIVIVDQAMLATRHLKSILELKAYFPSYAFIAKCDTKRLERLQHLLGDTLDGFLLCPYSSKQLEITILHAARLLHMRRTEQKKLAEVRQHRTFLEVVINGLPEATVVVSQDFKIELVNTQFEFCAGVTAKEIIGRYLHDFVEDGFKILSHIYRELTNGKPPEAYRINFKSLTHGEMDMHLHADFLTDSDNHYIRGLIVTMNHQTLKDTIIQQLLSQERLMVIRQLSQALAHEIQNPTHILSGRLQLLQSGQQNIEDRRALEIMQRQVERITDIITKMQKFHGNREDSVPEIFSLISFLEEAIPKVETACGREIVLRSQPAEKSLLVQANRRLLLDAFTYLFGIIAETTEADHQLKIQCHLLRPRGRSLHLELKIGLGKSEIPVNLFEPFKTQLTAEKYSTLDAAIVHGILANYQARIYVDKGFRSKKYLKIEFLVSGSSESQSSADSLNSAI